MVNRKIAIAAALAASMTASSAFAWWGDNDGRGQNNGPRHEQCERGRHGGGHGMKHRFGGKNMAEFMKKEFTADQIRTLQEAKLIMKDNPNIKVGEVKTTKTGYKVTIVTKDNSLVRELDLAKNGMPMKKFNKVQEKLAKKQ
ncbi:hypothetical protein EOPP23_07120 [Endozoicomonas sp. OPT23]|uniref:hypothetical protein n=1 Tax=Endozoicomonas sp. OPT23 TaxID=2072845 RepID=UPI00129C0319|nr:hypothetical protein [Endozoicomonas sp. OPT23]MRI32757.1 hypothetical protein [Endozoicomonas sp. OPT23]